MTWPKGEAVAYIDDDGEEHAAIVEDVEEPVPGEKRLVLDVDGYETLVNASTDRVEVFA